MTTKVQCATNVYNAVKVFNIATLSLSRNSSVSMTLHYLCTVFGLFHKIHAQVTFVLTHRHAMRSIVHVPPPHGDAGFDHVTNRLHADCPAAALRALAILRHHRATDTSSDQTHVTSERIRSSASSTLAGTLTSIQITRSYNVHV